MKNLLPRYAVYCFTACCLGFGLAASPAAFAANPPVDIDGTTAGSVYGNSNDGDAPTLDPVESTLNIISGGSVPGNAYGGYTDDPGEDARGNTVNVSGGSVDVNVYGGYSYDGSVTSNTVNVSGGSVDGDVLGGSSDTGNVTGNTVNVSGGSVGVVFGGFGFDGNATGNTVDISDGSVAEDVLGGYSDTGNATGNIVHVSGGTVGQNVLGGYSDTGDARGNTVNVSGGSVDVNVYGGYSDTGNVTGNTVNISGGTVDGNVIGGYSISGNATGNTVNISGSPAIATTRLIGGDSSGLGDVFTGNTLNLYSTGLSVAHVSRFQNLNFYLPTTFDGSTPVLTVTGTADISNSTIGVGINGGTSALSIGDSITLIDANTLNASPDINGKIANRVGGFQQIRFSLSTDSEITPTKLFATAIEGGPADGAEAASQGRLAGISMLNTQGDLIASQGVFLAKRASEEGRVGTGGFAAIGGGSMKQKTGSHADVDSFSLLAGAAYGHEMENARMTLGGFIEYGKGNYDTYNSFVRGNGDAWNIGAGVLGRMDFKNSLYAEGSVRIGRLKNDFNSHDLIDGYGASSMYYSLHAGLGYVFSLNEQIDLDLYGRLFWTHLGSKSVTSNQGDSLRFDSADSVRTRLGGRFSFTATDTVRPYAGLAYEYEFDGKANATVNGDSLRRVDLKGSTGVVELGLTITPSASTPLTLDLGIQGYVGKREGVTGSLRMNYRF